jgi:hypothetical protein
MNKILLVVSFVSTTAKPFIAGLLFLFINEYY